jgi:predicted nucleic acid-binding protein
MDVTVDRKPVCRVVVLLLITLRMKQKEKLKVKQKLLLTVLLIAGALVLLSSQAIAAPQSIEAKKTPAAADKDLEAKATQKAEAQALKAEAKALKAAEKVKKENYQGTISVVDAGSVTLLLKDGSVLVFAVTEETRLTMPTLKAATLEDFELGRNVKVKAIRAEDDTLTALSMKLVPGKPEKKYRVGIVTEYTPGESITIQAKEDKLFTYLLTEDTKILPTEREALLQVGAKVTIISPRDLTRIDQTALKIVVHPEGEEEPEP